MASPAQTAKAFAARIFIFPAGSSGPRVASSTLYFPVASNDCGSVVAPGVSCSITVTFTPTQVGAASGTITIVDDAADSPQSISLSGNGT